MPLSVPPLTSSGVGHITGRNIRSTDAVVGVMSSFTMYTTPWCGYCRRLKSQLDREGISYEVVDIEQHPEAAAIVEAANHGSQTVPTLVFPDGTALSNPSVAQVQATLDAL